MGTKFDLVAFCEFLEQTKLNLSPIIDRVFSFDDTMDALRYLAGRDVFGKVVVQLP